MREPVLSWEDRGKARRGVWTGAVVVAMLWVGGARADHGSPGRGGRPEALAVLLVGRDSGRVGRQLVEVVSAQVAGLPVRFRAWWVDALPARLAQQAALASRVARDTGASAVFWADLSTAGHIFVYLSNRRADRVLVRAISTETTSQADRLLATALVVESSLRHLLAGARIGFQGPAKTARIRRTVRPHWVELALSYGLSPLSESQPTVSGARIAISVELWHWLRTFLAYRFVLPVSVSTRDVDFRLEPHPFELGLAARWQLGRWALTGRGGVWVDHTTWSVRPVRPDVWAVPPDDVWQAGATAAGRVSFCPFFGGEMFLELGLDVPFVDRDYVLEEPQGRQVLVDPWPVRPWMALGVSVWPL